MPRMRPALAACQSSSSRRRCGYRDHATSGGWCDVDQDVVLSGTASSFETVRVTDSGSANRRLSDPRTSSKRFSLNALCSQGVFSTPSVWYVRSTNRRKSGICGALIPVPHRKTNSPASSELSNSLGNLGPSFEKRRDMAQFAAELRLMALLLRLELPIRARSLSRSLNCKVQQGDTGAGELRMTLVERSEGWGTRSRTAARPEQQRKAMALAARGARVAVREVANLVMG